MNFKLNLGLVSLSYLGQFNSKFNIQDEFWNLEIKSFHWAPRFMGLNALLIEKYPPKDSTEFIVSWVYVAPILIYIPWHILFKVYCLESLIWVSDDSVQVGPHSVIPDHFLGQGAGKWLWNRLWNRFAEYKSVDCFKTWSKAWFWNK